MADGKAADRAGSTAGERVWAHVKAMAPTILVFLVVGPLVGYFAIMLPIGMTAIDGPFGFIDGVIGALALLPVGGLFAYMLGYLPALVTGLVVAVADCIVDFGAYRTPAAIMAGCFVTLLLLLNVSDAETTMDLGLWRFPAAAAAVGAIAAGVCAMIAPRRVPSPPLA